MTEEDIKMLRLRKEACIRLAIDTNSASSGQDFMDLVMGIYKFLYPDADDKRWEIPNWRCRQ